MNRRNTIYTALPVVAATYAENYGVRVVMGHDEASTDGKTIVIPNVPESYPHLDCLWGYLSHEAAHCLLTDFSTLEHIKSPLEHRLFNIFEDTRIERAFIELYPGAAYTLHETARYMLSAGHYEEITEDHHPASVLDGYCLYWLQCYLVGQTVLEPMVMSADKAAKAVLPVGVRTRLAALLRKVTELKDSWDTLALVHSVIKMLKDEQEKSQGQPQVDDGDQQSQGQPRDCDGVQQSQGQPQSGGCSSQQQLLQTIMDAQADDLTHDVYQSLAHDLESSAIHGDNSVKTIPVPKQQKGSGGADLLSDVRTVSSQLSQQLYGLVQASQQRKSRIGRAGKRISAKRATRILTGDTRVFEKRAAKREPNTAVHLLIDMSSSMNQGHGPKSPAQIARESSLALALALENIKGVNPAVTFFSSTAKQPVQQVVRHGERVLQKLDHFMVPATGSTPMAEAIWFAGYELSRVKEERKLVIVVTDGDPNNAFATRNVIERCVNGGFEFIGVGVKSTAVKKFFDNNIVINDVQELRTTLFSLMASNLSIM